MTKPRIGLQLYSVREECACDLPGTLRAVAEMGYRGVEFAGYHGRTASDLRRMLDDLGLDCCGSHIPLEALLGERFSETVEFNLALGNRYLIVPGLPQQYRASHAAWVETAELFNDLCERLAPNNLRVGYHNHSHEFEPMDGEAPWDTFFGRTRTEVIMQLDTGNAMHGGASPVRILKRYAGRAVTVHLKKYSSTNERALLGEGDVPWWRVFGLCEITGATEWYIVEQETYPFRPLECVRRCLANLRALGR